MTMSELRIICQDDKCPREVLVTAPERMLSKLRGSEMDCGNCGTRVMFVVTAEFEDVRPDWYM